LDSQKNIFDKIGVGRYLDYRGTTNTRGVNLSLEAEETLNKNLQTVSLQVMWQKSDVVVNPIDKWTAYWKEK
jgi:hypothetical protein